MNTYNENPAWLREAVKSYLNQTGVEVELIISTVHGDKNWDYISSLPCRKVQSVAPSVYGQLNAALECITGEWFAYASSNDYAEPYKLIREVERCKQTGKKICYSSFWKCNEKLRPMNVRKARPYDYHEHMKGNFVNDCALVHRSIIDKYAPFQNDKWGNHSYHDFWLRIYEGEGNVFCHNENPTWYYRTHNGLRVTRSKSQKGTAENSTLRQKMLSHHSAKCNIQNVENVAKIDDICDNEGINEGINETHFVYVYVANAAKWNELTISIQSIRKHFQGKYKIFVIGDAPGVTGVIHIPVTQIKGRGCKPKDAINKLKVICDCKQINTDFIYCYDDQILLRPITENWFNKIIANEHVKDYTQHWNGAKGVIPDQGWRSLFLNTFAMLTKRGLPLYNFETHLPRKLNKQMVLNVIEAYGDKLESMLFNSVYYNTHKISPNVLLKVQNTIKAGLHRAYDKDERMLEEMKGKIWLNYSDPAVNDKFKKLVNKIMKGEVKI